MIMLAFMVIIGKVLLFRSEREFPSVHWNKKAYKFSDLLILVELVNIIRYDSYRMSHTMCSQIKNY